MPHMQELCLDGSKFALAPGAEDTHGEAIVAQFFQRRLDIGIVRMAGNLEEEDVIPDTALRGPVIEVRHVQVMPDEAAGDVV